MSFVRRMLRTAACPALALAAACLAAACGEPPPEPGEVRARADGNPVFAQARPSGQKIAVIGIDGASLDVLMPLVEAGELPEFGRLIQNGVVAPLESLEPTVSPAIWTTIASGRRPETHGIADFNVRGPGQRVRLVSTRDRRTVTLWNIAGPFGLSAGVIGWWVTWPAEPVRGFVVSDRVAWSRVQSWADGKKTSHLTYPPELYEELDGLVCDPADPPLPELTRIADLSPAEIEEMLAVPRPILFHWLSVFKSGLCEQLTYERIALELLERGQPDLFLLLLIANDPINHTFWHFYDPASFDEPVDPAMAERLGDVIPNVYRHNDRVLAALRERLDDDTAVFVVSDHGFGPSGRLPKPSSWAGFKAGERSRIERVVAVGQSGSHRIDGVLIASGGPIRAGAKPAPKASVIDLAPTLLALAGLPVPRDMPGRVLEEIVDPAFLAGHPVRTIDSYETLIDAAPILEAAETLDEPRLEYLRALGYIE